MFAPAIGINEDPVTGNANGPLGAYIVHHKLVKHNKSLCTYFRNLYRFLLFIGKTKK
ncbi:hypothetical protein AN2V17_13700 [Vallitalea sp. AN17-2]|uniref:Uncharacterized protein n=2 Tax=Vallitalea maricola TaxID=3074433 RepID=A0ACB5UHX3_9FIRM|nr:hypothetical protein AN2V17_13700 [Vallitalea sp. AN17-2]